MKNCYYTSLVFLSDQIQLQNGCDYIKNSSKITDAIIKYGVKEVLTEKTVQNSQTIIERSPTTLLNYLLGESTNGTLQQLS